MNPAGWDFDATLVYLDTRAYTRVAPYQEAIDADWVRIPFGIFWLRGDTAGPTGQLAEQARASFRYWHLDSGDSIDIIWPGWTAPWEADGWNLDHIEFQPEQFLEYRSELEYLTSWRYSGRAELLVTSFEFPAKGLYDPEAYDYDREPDRGFVDWQASAIIPVEAMIESKQLPSLDEFMHLLVAKAKELSVKESKPVWELSAGFVTDRATRNFWEWVKQRLGVAGTVVSVVEHYRVRDLRPE